MNTKLTLSIEKEVIDKIKIYAKGTGRSVSEMVENYFRSLVEKPNKTKTKDEYEDIHPSVKKLIGRITLPDDFDIKKAREEHYKEKYGI
jgi:hypothetical protein